MIKPNLSVLPFLLAMKEPSAPNPTATANEKNRNEVVKLSLN